MMKRDSPIGGTIDIRIYKENDLLVLQVEDNGPGFLMQNQNKSPDYFDRKHLGIDLTRKRLNLIQKTSPDFEVFEILDLSEISESQGTKVTLKLKKL